MRTGAAVVTFLLAGCATMPLSTSPPLVAAIAETDPVDTAADAADDPAIWRNAANPARSLVIGTDKQAGIHVHDLSGRRLSFTPAVRSNNIDLRELPDRVIVAASDRAQANWAKMSLFLLDTAAARLQPLGRFPIGPGEAYGMCLWRRAGDGTLFGFVVMKDGRIDQVAIDLSGEAPRVRPVRSMKVPSQAEGCVVDDRTGVLYVAEEDAGIWRFAADPGASVAGKLVARVDARTLVADAEGLALAPQGRRGGYLIASSQGDNAYTAYHLPGMRYAGRFRIGGGTVDATSETDGIDLALGDFGPRFPDGLFVAQDGDNAPATQNFKYAGWVPIRAALGLRR
ncbi:phytase [uncultured Sphingomonas sp.]|uniref:phytase n=1 Tax=uncultured Sphingomonas sp. TaxID=158754 RepID=UPI0035C976A3